VFKATKFKMAIDHPNQDVPLEPRNRRTEKIERVEHVERQPRNDEAARSGASRRARPFKLKPIYKYALAGLFLLAIANAYLVPSLMFLGGKLLWNRAGAHQGVMDKQLSSLGNVFESARDKGLEGYESFIDTLKDHQRRLDEYYHPEHKSWTQAASDQYHGAVNKLSEWNCKAEEKIHELRYGKKAIPYSCEAKPLLSKAYDKVAGAAEAVKESIPGLRHKTLKEGASDAADKLKDGAKQAADKAADAVGLDDLETAFNKARDQGQDQLRSLADSIKDQRAKLERMYDETLERASSVGDTSSDKAKEWKQHFKQQAGDSIRSFREMSDEFEQRIQDFLGTDKSRWGFFNRLKFW